MSDKERVRNSERDRKINTMFPKTKRILENKLKVTVDKLTNMYKQGVPWQHDAGGFHFDLRNLEAERSRLEATLRGSEVVMLPDDPTVAILGAKVTLEVDGEEEVYLLGSQLDALALKSKEFREQWLSIESPLGSHLLGKEAGTSTIFKTPDGSELSIKVVSISRIPEEVVT